MGWPSPASTYTCRAAWRGCRGRRLSRCSGWDLASGWCDTEEDPDGKMRRTRFAYTDGANTYVTLPVAVAADLLGATQVTLSPGELRIG